MAYQVDLDVDTFGVLEGDGVFPLQIADHDWRLPYPAMDTGTSVPFTWDRGEAGVMPNVFWYPHMWDWVCDMRAYALLCDIAPGDINTIGQGELDGQPMRIVQAIGLLDIVDPEHSHIRKYPTYEILDFPAFSHSFAADTARRIFRVPQSTNLIFMGDDVVTALITEGITGFTLAKVDWC